MSQDYLNLPGPTAYQSLSSQLQALELFGAQLSSLKTKAEWETKAALTSEATVNGGQLSTANVKINVGGGWWIDMTLSEGEAWVKRQKAALLEEHAKILEKWSTGMKVAETKADESQPRQVDTPLDPGPGSQIKPAEPIQAESSLDRSKQPEAVKSIVSESARTPPAVTASLTSSTANSKPPVGQMVKETEPRGIAKGKGKSKDLLSEITRDTLSSTSPNPIPATTRSTGQNSEAKTLANALSQFMETQNALAQATGSATMPTGNPGEAMINEEGLPIHEIREDENGKLLNDLPVGKAEVEVEVVKEEQDDFWSKEAVARREALRRKVFDDPSDSEDESEVEDVAPRDAPVSSPSITATPPTPSSQTANPILEPARRSSSSSSSTLQPKSILKSSTPRKKSVSFDSSVPVPPDSPGQSSTKIGGSMFPHPVINIETGIEERSVPVLNAPKRSPNRATFEEPFAGFKAGFLAAGKGKVDPPSPVNLTAEPDGMMMPMETKSTSAQKPGASPAPKKKSLFAQRQSDPSSEEPKPSFPPMSTSTHTSSVKNEIIERPSAPSTQISSAGPSRIPSKDRITGRTAGVASTVTERSEPEPVAGPSRLTSHLPPSNSNDEGYEDDEDDDDDDSFYADDDDDEYDLDDALLAREVALAYHQNRAYSLLGQQNARSQRSSDDNPDGFDESYVDGYGSEEGEEGGVMLGIPQISMLNEGGMPSIVNPTPDDLRRFVRVGKLDNGKLVLAPGEDGWSDEDEGRDVKQVGNREEIKAALLGRGGPTVPQVQERRKGDEAIGMPPVIESAPRGAAQGIVQEKSISSPASTPNEAVEPPKKVSRFKAARMG